MRVAIKGVPSEPQPSSPQSAALPALIDNPFAPEVFATGLSGFANLNGVIVLTLESARCDHARQPPSVDRVVVGRVALTSGAAQDLVAGLNQFLEQQGLSPSKAMASGATFQ
ncbi:hypothetical protein C8J45_1047 [Sphingomonas sp. PP-CE-3G-477]|uniref:hypothetical protein n=1 Tax=unclassified Sphingomonas TaxID=196159 RepID=UPI000D430A99|nr:MULTISPECIES: hypothetical protein [unclassified Sphingomonas]PTQ63764.1 hypothetical protein C8J45_1047 [Sphingomonas sp. PP-CE-3G-477]